ncbi:PPPDE putative peptidase domain-domain-containing protein [Clohesyomyces aquaticus]|uniref:PPPDE putative peptidase domain-domain-containing protein n=1 Tax=Clohesyomyces aquaticus TaxID=1231657 RepID=A0A1Y1ZFR2_9PLEO|nr:PPPDE putative peptidase domain-domain-containing protein [Clohesyomyces aquaticus]
MSSSTRPKPSRKSSANHRTTLSLQKTEVRIHVYDLLPPGKVSSVLWALGSSLLHSGVVINGKEYAYGGHEKPGHTGVYWTNPGLEPPGGTFRLAILHGFSFRPEEELKAIISEASEQFQGTSYNLLTKNCNHFTSYLCKKLTSRLAPSWLNRAASIGVALPCVVPREWIAPPDHDTADGELLDEDFDEDERSSMLRSDNRRRHRASEDERQSWDSEMDRISSSNGGNDVARLVEIQDSSGRTIPAAERAPLPRRIT